jgi:hypothetical protein
MPTLIASLKRLRDECNQLNPNRDRTSDGWIGDPRHQARKSDHNPAPDGEVHAIDVDKDGLDVNRVVAHLVARCRSGQEKRLTYIIWNRTIWSASRGWTARRYTGQNPHTHHFHVSGSYDPANERNTASYGLAELGATAVKAQSQARPGSRTLRLSNPQMRGEDVRFVQRSIGQQRAGAADGIYGPKTAAGVRSFQQSRHIAADGIVGPVTWRQLGVKV